MLWAKGKRLVLHDCDISHNNESNIMIQDGCADVQRCRISRAAIAGVAVQGGFAVITKCCIYDNDEDGVLLQAKSSAKVTHNDVYNNGSHGIFVGYDAVCQNVVTQNSAFCNQFVGILNGVKKAGLASITQNREDGNRNVMRPRSGLKGALGSFKAEIGEKISKGKVSTDDILQEVADVMKQTGRFDDIMDWCRRVQKTGGCRAEFFDKMGLPCPEAKKTASLMVAYGYKCAQCGKGDGARLQKCSKCEKVVYCSKECHDLDWPNHQSFCKEHKKVAYPSFIDRSADVLDTQRIQKGLETIPFEHALDLINQSAGSGSTDGMVQKASILAQSYEWEKAAVLLQTAVASNSNPAAAFMLGHFLYKNKLKERDGRKAEKYLKIAAESGMAEAMAELGNMYLGGCVNLQANQKLGEDWWSKAEKADPRIKDKVTKASSRSERRKTLKDMGFEGSEQQLDDPDAMMDAIIRKAEETSPGSKLALDKLRHFEKPVMYTKFSTVDEKTGRVGRILEAAKAKPDLGPHQSDAVLFAHAFHEAMEFSSLFEVDRPRSMACLARAYELDEKAVLMLDETALLVRAIASDMTSSKDRSTRCQGLWILAACRSNPMDAVPVLRQLTREEPSARAYAFQADMMGFCKQWNGVIDSAKKAVELDAGYHAAYYILAVANNNREKCGDEVLKYCEMYLEKAPSDARKRVDTHFMAASTHALKIYDGEGSRESLEQVRFHRGKAKELEPSIVPLWGPATNGSRDFVEALDMDKLGRLLDLADEQPRRSKTGPGKVLRTETKCCAHCGGVEQTGSAGACPCGDVWYCCSACQSSNWKMHKTTCSSKKRKGK
mmetsp:Transcript_102198/g.329706  ORF Transcript_102198/g.329706 Transcript_102198/m.329706 type:complete len:834 (+) Transcript_102198:170-2671(+)